MYKKPANRLEAAKVSLLVACNWLVKVLGVSRDQVLLGLIGPYLALPGPDKQAG